jgi:hypothetical protein
MIIMMIVIMIIMVVIMIVMVAVMIAVDQDAAAQKADHYCCENKEQNSFHHGIGGVFSLVGCHDAIVPAFGK